MNPAAKSIRVALIAIAIGAAAGIAQFVAVKLTSPPSDPRYGTINGTPAEPGVWYAVTISQPTHGTPTTNVKVIR